MCGAPAERRFRAEREHGLREEGEEGEAEPEEGLAPQPRHGEADEVAEGGRDRGRRLAAQQVAEQARGVVHGLLALVGSEGG